MSLLEPRVLLLVIGDGRDDLRAQTLDSFTANALGHEIAGTVEVDDRHHLLGFCGAIRFGWERIRALKLDFEYVFHLEEDWRFDRAFNLSAMTSLLDLHFEIKQVALRRGKEPAEHAAPVDAWPESFHDRGFTTLAPREHGGGDHPYLLHRSFFTTNPSVYRRELVEEYDWPAAPKCEGAFTEMLLADGASFAYWGDRDDEPWITHTGQRTGHGY